MTPRRYASRSSRQDVGEAIMAHQHGPMAADDVPCGGNVLDALSVLRIWRLILVA